MLSPQLPHSHQQEAVSLVPKHTSFSISRIEFRWTRQPVIVIIRDEKANYNGNKGGGSSSDRAITPKTCMTLSTLHVRTQGILVYQPLRIN